MKVICFSWLLAFALNGYIDGKHYPADSSISNYTILFVFSGSDWCSGCIKLDRKILSDSVFLGHLKLKQVDLQRIDFPQHKKLSSEARKYNESVAKKFGFDGTFPTIVIFSPVKERYKRILYQEESPIDFSNKVISEADKLHE